MTRRMPDGYQVTTRDRLAWWLATQVLRLASRQYRSWLYLMNKYGRLEIERQLREGDGRG